jgi:metal-responsive CopG/Arc/MetJ family transcriptional regulator
MEKSSTYTIRVPEELKLEFEKATKENDQRGSQVLRKHMRDYIRVHEENVRRRQQKRGQQ